MGTLFFIIGLILMINGSFVAGAICCVAGVLSFILDAIETIVLLLKFYMTDEGGH